MPGILKDFNPDAGIVVTEQAIRFGQEAHSDSSAHSFSRTQTPFDC